MKAKLSEIVLTENQFANFEAKVDRSGECHIWTGAADKKGYGRFGVGQKSPALTHRLAYLIRHKTIPDNLLVCHRCDNPRCVNPDHLFLGTYHDNNSDCASKGRNGKWTKPESTPRGGTHGNSLLTDGKVLKMRAQYATGAFFQIHLAEIYSIKQTTVSGIVRHYSWRHLP